MAAQKKKKIDYEALNSAFMRIPKMDIVAARALIDIGLQEVYELSGRSPESLLEELKKHRTVLLEEARLLSCFRLAVYYAEAEDPDVQLLDPACWA